MMADFYTLLCQIGWGLFHLFVFPGGIFALLFGLLLKGLDRKLEARLQRRIGPPVLQAFMDTLKLFGKELMIPVSAQRTVFLASPFVGIVGMGVCAALLPIPGVYSGMNMMGDLLVYFYLLPIPAIALMMGGSASGSPFGALGFSREMIMTFAYEVPLLLVILTVALKVGGSSGAEFSLGNIVAFQQQYGSFGLNPALLPAFIAYLMFLPGTMGVPPFDVPEAETEIIEGPLLEYSGPALACFQLGSALKTVVVLGLGIVLFFPGTCPGGWFLNILWFSVKCLILMAFAITLVKSVTGRFRIEQAFRFYLKYPTVLAAVSLLLVLADW